LPPNQLCGGLFISVWNSFHSRLTLMQLESNHCATNKLECIAQENEHN
jgi:hypothetical protein